MTAHGATTTFSCAKCRCEFAPMDGGHCEDCGKLFCRAHLSSAKLGPDPGRRCHACAALNIKPGIEMRSSARRLPRLLLAVCAGLVLLAAAAALFYPKDGHGFAGSFVWWAISIPVGIAACLALEAAGTWALEREFWKRMPSALRVLLLVALIGLAGVTGVFVLGNLS